MEAHHSGDVGAAAEAIFIGFGGMGVVLKGFEVALDRYVAIKVLSPHLPPGRGGAQY
jgi:hypothetical protein